MAGLFSFTRKLSHPGDPREPLRRIVREASSGDHRAFLVLAGRYTDLVAENLFMAGYAGREELFQRTLDLFVGIAKDLLPVRRLADFERLVGRELLSTPAHPRREADGLVKSLHQLDERAQFALVAAEMEKWDHRWIAAACRTKPGVITEELFRTRCRLAGTETADLGLRAMRCLNKVNSRFDDRASSESAKKRVAETRQNSAYPEVREFRARWVSIRCEMIELFHEVRFTDAERVRFNRELALALDDSQRLTPTSAPATGPVGARAAAAE